MRKAIQLFIEDDETQLEKEEALLPVITQNYNKSLTGFQRTVPSIYKILKNHTFQHNSVYVNKDGEIDIVESSSGTVFYGSQVSESISRHIEHFLANPQQIQLSTAEECSTSITPQSSEHALVVFGVGLGRHLVELLNATDIKHIVVYEPNMDYLVCSLYAGVWPRIFDIAKRKNVSLYLQMPNNGKSLFSDLNELNRAFGISSSQVYFHYHCSEFDDIRDELTANNWCLNRDLRPDVKEPRFENYVPKWTPVVSSSLWSSDNLDHDRFECNLEAFKKYFPDIAEEFAKYTPVHWQVVANAAGEVNLLNVKHQTYLFGDDAKKESENIYAMFKDNPSRDELILNYTGGKLYPHFHYRTVVRIQNEVKKYTTDSAVLNDNIRSLLLFGIGNGYQLQRLSKAHEIGKLFVYEPNRDFFYSSLYSIDWTALLEKMDASESSIYLNIGDDGSNLVRDFLTQFDRVGSYNLANMFLLKSYDNDVLEPTLNNLREEIRLVIGLSDNFENSRYIVSHSKWSVENNFKYLLKSETKPHVLNDVPVFIVGNGPSLDNLLPILKEEHSNAIVVSCGTALQVLHKNHIVPDYHVDLEVNRSPYDWLVRINDKEYLKKINLISGTGVHPDVISAYKNAFLSLKKGEPATLILESLFSEHDFVSLEYSYPTVSNFAIDCILELGFKQIYLFGVDLGFVDYKHHHSKQSGYYLEDGEELIEYARAYNTSLTVEGNLRPFVNTKYEFKMSKTIIELALGHASTDVDVYNLNDGAKIKGTIPLEPENILILSDGNKKAEAIDWLENTAHQTLDKRTFAERFNENIKNSDLLYGLSLLKKAMSQPFKERADAEKAIINSRKIIIDLFRDDKPIVIYYLHGSVNYVNTVLSKTLNMSDDAECLELLNGIREQWILFLADTSASMEVAPYELDFISCSPLERAQIRVPEYYVGQSLTVYSEYAKTALESAASLLGVQFNKSSPTSKKLRIEFYQDDLALATLSPEKLCLIVTSQEDLERLLTVDSDALLVYLPQYFNDPNCHFGGFGSKENYAFFIALIAATSSPSVKVVVPKLLEKTSFDVLSEHLTAFACLSTFINYESHYYTVFTREYLTEKEMVNGVDERFRFLPAVREENLFLVL
ncbi:motility associated factor glycosyltransferase family protein [Alteromonas sp.]|uniref:motility associated factor glycosyltransferase family protein n=1 Tax=Alteromonas sp. TaxID=232 RepID=UPI00257D45AF|nr:6-hydroxymethylpterin diphosphokinase MptE-like protein [Alteromonas sp.]NQY17563.1 motility associated factor glycosyltransferase family protein [Alteromonas sp.]